MNSIKLKPFLETANVWARNSSCCRVNVGAVIFNMKTKRLLSIGYNGTLPGQVHCDKLFFIDSDSNYYYVCDKINNFLNDVSFNDSDDYLWYRMNDDYPWHRVNEQKFKELHHRFSELYEVHAEQNAIYNLIKTGTSYDTDNLAIITTVEPCEQCAKAIAALGIKYVFYEVAYDRNIINIPEYFSKLGIVCEQVESDGESL